MLFRGIGALLIAIASGGYGFTLKKNYKERIRNLEAIQRTLEMLKEEIAMVAFFNSVCFRRHPDWCKFV